MTIISKDVEFQLLPTNEVLVSVTVSVGKPEQNDMTTVVRQRISCDEFCTKAFPIMYQNYNSWPPNYADAAKTNPMKKLPPAAPSSPSPREVPPILTPHGPPKPPSLGTPPSSKTNQ